METVLRCTGSLLILSLTAHAVIVDTPSGKVEGYQRQSPLVSVFKGIPYSKPPARFEKAELIEPWQDVKNATQFGPQCIQVTIPGSEPPMNEDCLFLNIYVPGNIQTGSRKAVMIFIHGGGVQVGSADMYDGSMLATQGDVIVVTINYRLNVFGFLYGSDTENPPTPNIGLWDQHLAFQWVHKNIEAFGGDVDRVTIFGQSGGSWSVALQTLSPVNNASLFQRAIYQSGGYLMIPLGTVDKRTDMSRIASAAGCVSSISSEQLKCLKNLPYEKLLEAISSEELTILPVKDSVFLLASPLDVITSYALKPSSDWTNLVGSLGDYDTLLGYNSQEGLLSLQMLKGISNPNGLSEQQWSSNMAFFLRDTSASQQATFSNMVAAQYAGVGPAGRSLSEQRLRMITDVWGDLNLVWPTIESALLHSAASSQSGRKTYFYVFDVKREDKKWLWPEGPEWLKTGADHGEELPFLFGAEAFSGPNVTIVLNEAEMNLSRALITYWTNFAKTGDPKTQSMVSRGGVTWPQMMEGDRNYLRFSLTTDVIESRPLGGRADFWRSAAVAARITTEPATSPCTTVKPLPPMSHCNPIQVSATGIIIMTGLTITSWIW